jgi:glycosyltransferase involved in cell wall biosynthesis
MHAFAPWIKEDGDFIPYTASRFLNVHRLSPPAWYRNMPFQRLKGFFSIPDSYLYLNLLYLKHLKNLDNYGAVITWSMYHSIHLLGLYAKKHFPHIPWVAHFSDPWTTNPFFKENFLITMINQAFEKRVFSQADILTFTSEETIHKALSKYPNSVRIKAKTIFHAYDEALYPKMRMRKSEKLVVRYLGAFYGDRNPDTFIQAIKIIASRSPEIIDQVKIEFIGTSQNSVQFDSLASQYFSFQDPVDYLTSLKLMKSADLLLVIDAPYENSPFLPSKLVDYIGANKPIFGVTPRGTSQKLIEEIGFLVANPTNSEDIANQFVKMITSIRSGSLKGIPQAIRNRYSISAVGQQVSEILQKVIR